MLSVARRVADARSLGPAELRALVANLMDEQLGAALATGAGSVSGFGIFHRVNVG